MTLNREELLKLARESDMLTKDFVVVATRNISDFADRLERFASLVLSAAQEEREPVAWMWEYIGKDPMAHLLRPCARSFHEMDPHNNPHKDHWKPVAPLYLAPFSSNQACNAAMLEQWDAAYTAFTGAFDTPVARRNLTDEYCSDARRRMRDFDESIRSLKRPLQAQEPASPAAQSGAVDEPTTDDLPPLPAMAMTITDEPGKGHYYSANQMREYARLSRAQAAPDEVQAAEATLYRDLTGDAMAMGYDGIPAALEALRAQAAQQAQPVSDERTVDEIVTALYRRFKDWSKRGFGPDDVTWCEVKADVVTLISQSAAPVSEQPAAQTAGVPDEVEQFLSEVRAELKRARSKFPGDRIMTIALAEEFGELCKAVLDESAANVRKEAVQTAVMAARVVLDGDGSVTDWRRERGLDPLAVAPQAAQAKGGEDA